MGGVRWEHRIAITFFKALRGSAFSPLFTPLSFSTPLVPPRTPDYLLPSISLLAAVSLSPLLENHFPFLIRPFSLPSFLPPRSFNLRFEDYKSFTSLASSLPQPPRPGNFLRFSTCFRASLCLQRGALFGSFDNFCSSTFCLHRRYAGNWITI